MKKINIPVFDDKSTIDLSCINDCYQGIIIVYKQDKPVGYISYDDHEWGMSNEIDRETTDWYPSLLDLIKDIIKLERGDSFKTLDFE
jgi:hypothetical protein